MTLETPYAEAATLASAMQDEDARREIMQVVSAKDFADPKHRALMKAIESRIMSGQDVDPLLIRQDMENAGEFDERFDLRYLQRMLETLRS